MHEFKEEERGVTEQLLENQTQISGCGYLCILVSLLAVTASLTSGTAVDCTANILRAQEFLERGIIVLHGIFVNVYAHLRC